MVYYLRSSHLKSSLAPSKRQIKIVKSCFTYRSSTHFSSSSQLSTKVADLEISSRTLGHRKANHITCHSQLESVLPRAWTTVSSLWKFHILKQCSDIKCRVPMSQTGFLFWNHVFKCLQRGTEKQLLLSTLRGFRSLSCLHLLTVWAWPCPGNRFAGLHWLSQTWSLLVHVCNSRYSTSLKCDTEVGICNHWHGDLLSGSDSAVRDFRHAPSPLSLPYGDCF